MTHLLAYDHVLGADPNRPGGFKGAYDKDVAFHEPLTFFAFAAAVTTTSSSPRRVLILPQRQAVLVAKQAAEVAVAVGQPAAPRDRHRLEQGRVRRRSTRTSTTAASARSSRSRSCGACGPRTS